MVVEKGKEPVLVCSICIDRMEDYTWQGRVVSEGDEEPFRSERELMQAVERLLDRRQGCRHGPRATVRAPVSGDIGKPDPHGGPCETSEKEEENV